MPKVPERKPSLGEINRTYIRSTHGGTKDFATFVYKEATSNSKHGAVKTTRLASNSLPHPFKCSACSYTADNGVDIKRHWSEEH